MRTIIMLFTFVLFTGSLSAQENPNLVKKISVGMELQWYPAGWIIGPVASYRLAPKHLLHVRTAANIANRHDWGKNDNEKGTGYGGSLGYRFVFTPDKNSFFLGARLDFWGMKIDWKNNTGTPQATAGQTKISIFQPTAEAGYRVGSNNQRLNFLFTAGGGTEINIKTNGKEVGEGGMWLLGVSAYYAL